MHAIVFTIISIYVAEYLGDLLFWIALSGGLVSAITASALAKAE